MKKAWMTTMLAAGCAMLLACAEADPDAHTGQLPVDAFMQEVAQHCGKSFAGRIVDTNAANEDRFEDRVFVMHLAECGPDLIRMPFQAADERERALVLQRTTSGLHLHHEHLREDGVPLPMSDYGGSSIAGNGSALRQEFEPDPYTIAVLEMAGIPDVSANTWVLEIEPGRLLRYKLLRGAAPHVVIEFDLEHPLELPEHPLVLHERLKQVG